MVGCWLVFVDCGLLVVGCCWLLLCVACVLFVECWCLVLVLGFLVDMCLNVVVWFILCVAACCLLTASC